MYKGKNTRIVPIIIGVVIIALIIAALVSLIRMVLSSGDKKPADNAKVVDYEKELLTVNEGRSVRLTVRGQLVADEQFRSYQIVVSPLRRTLLVLAGYDGRVIDRKEYPNSPKAYEEFVYALDKSEATKTKELKGEKDFRGVCATGRAFMYEVLDGGRVVQSQWTSSCEGSQGDMGARIGLIHRLFAEQIPEFKVPFTAVN